MYRYDGYQVATRLSIISVEEASSKLDWKFVDDYQQEDARQSAIEYGQPDP